MKTFIVILGLAFVSVGCEKKAEEPTATETAAQETNSGEAAANDEPAADEAPAEGATNGAEVAVVEVSAEGTKFDPAVKPEQIPNGAWYCDMGTVHYARAEKGDGKCELCGMALKEKGAAPAADGDGHDHGEGGHDHEHGEDGHEH